MGKLTTLTTACLLVVAIVTTGAAALSCSCDPETCPDPASLKCEGGLKPDACGCCMECARVRGESCGGLYNTWGKCDDGLFCYISPLLDNSAGTLAGECRERNPDCSNVTCTTDVDEPCPRGSLRRYRRLEPGLCCPRASECVCAPECPPAEQCPGGQVSALITRGNGRVGSCCDEHACRDPGFECSDTQCVLWTCPADSVHDFEDDQGEPACCPTPTERMCKCDPMDPLLCPKPDCPTGTRPYVSHRRIGASAGFCCDQYECLAAPLKQKGCAVRDHLYEHGAKVYSAEECTWSECQYGILKTRPVECGAEADCSQEHYRKCCEACGGSDPHRRGEAGEAAEYMEDTVCRDPATGGSLREIGSVWSVEKDFNCTRCECRPGGKIECVASMCHAQSCGKQHYTCDLDCSGRGGLFFDVHGCNTCTCKKNDVDDDDLCPSMAGCTLRCPRGFERDERGCERCRCQARKRKRCRNLLANCQKDCPYGYKQKQHCPRCKCLPCPEMRNCSLKCKHGYRKNAFQCRTCECEEVEPSIIDYDRKEGSCTDHEGKTRGDGERWPLSRCTRCMCGGGTVYCETIRCPAPACANPVFVDGHCCPQCVDDSRHLPALAASPGPIRCGPGRVEGETWTAEGGCSTCLCLQGRVSCNVTRCPPLPCKVTIQEKGECCRKCSDLTPSMTSDDLLQLARTPKRDEIVCRDRDLVVRSWGELWWEGPCVSCVCISGHKRCYSEKCPTKLPCRNPVLLPGTCCPRCPADDNADAYDDLVTCDVRTLVASASGAVMDKTTTTTNNGDDEGDTGVVTMKLPAGGAWPLDCNNCTCASDGRGAVCSPPVCPELRCGADDLVVTDDLSCCPRCVKPPTSRPTTTTTTTSTTVKQRLSKWKIAPTTSSTTSSSSPPASESDPPRGAGADRAAARESQSQILVGVCTFIIACVIVLLYVFVWNRKNKKSKSKKDSPDRYPNVKPQLVEPVSCL